MKNTVRHIVLLLLFLLIFTGGICWAADIKSIGSWSETIDSLDLQAGPGSDLIGTYESASNQIKINVESTNEYWRVDVRKSDTNWHSNFQLSVRRTSDGTGNSPVSGGTSYQEITDIDQSFFNGHRQRTDIDVQLKLTGISIQIPPDTYTTTVNYTVVEI